MRSRQRWTRPELLATFRLYCHTPFGRLYQNNPEIIKLAEMLGRTSGAVTMKACNFASLDPAQQARGITALSNVSSADRELWHDFLENPTHIADQAEDAYRSFLKEGGVDDDNEELWELPDGPTEVERLVRTRRVQRFFSRAVLAAYDFRCALTGLAVRDLINASHIIPWSKDERRRADPRNGIALNALHDRAFDNGLISFDDDSRVLVSDRLHDKDISIAEFHRRWLLGVAGEQLRAPQRFVPDIDALQYHRECVFAA